MKMNLAERCNIQQWAAILGEDNPFFHLHRDQLDEAQKLGLPGMFKTAEALFSAGEPAIGIYLILSGAAKVTQPYRGREVTVRFAAQGEWVGHRSLFTRTTYLGSAVARGPTQTFFLPSQLLLKFFSQNTEFASHLIGHIAQDLDLTERKFFEYQELNVPSRLISLFRSLNEKFGTSAGSEHQLQLRLSKVEISELIGASQEVVVRQLSKWKKENLIREEGKNFLISNRLLARVTRAH